jgi:hypothetical protein
VLSIDLDIPRSLLIFNHHEFVVLDDVVRAAPLQVLEDHAPLGEVGGVFVELSSVGREVLIRP